jgi:hypothetical protein
MNGTNGIGAGLTNGIGAAGRGGRGLQKSGNLSINLLKDSPGSVGALLGAAGGSIASRACLACTLAAAGGSSLPKIEFCLSTVDLKILAVSAFLFCASGWK